jgi:putative phage-type endonuclease
MPITPEQLAERKNHLGASDMAAVMGVDPYRTGYDVWLEKTERIIDVEIKDKRKSVMSAGNYFENGVLDFAEEELGKLNRNVTLSLPGTALVSNLDAALVDSGVPVEAKTVGLFGPVAEWWGDEGTDQVPDRVIVQCHVQMLCAVKDRAHVAAFIGGRGFALFNIFHSPALAEVILKSADEFWAKNVQADTPPTNSTASLQIVKRIRREAEKVVEIDRELVQKYLDADLRLRSAEEEQEEAKARVIQALGDAEAGACGELGAVTYYQQHRKETVQKACDFRVLRYTKKGLKRS